MQKIGRSRIPHSSRALRVADSTEPACSKTLCCWIPDAGQPRFDLSQCSLWGFDCQASLLWLWKAKDLTSLGERREAGACIAPGERQGRNDWLFGFSPVGILHDYWLLNVWVFRRSENWVNGAMRQEQGDFDCWVSGNDSTVIEFLSCVITCEDAFL